MVVLGCGVTLQASPSPTPPFQRVRSIDAVVLQRVQDGFRRSPTFRALVLAVERSNVIVYLVPGVCDLGRIAGCLLRFVHVAGDDRYLRVVVNVALPEDRLVAVIGHELQHVREVVDAPAVVDGPKLLTLLRDIGLRECRGVLGECYETKAAIEVEDAVLKELGKQYHYIRP